MKITRKSILTGKVRTKELNVTFEQLNDYYGRRLLLQDAFPQLSTDDREFIKTGIVAEEWPQAR